jgi:hypothetical protein
MEFALASRTGGVPRVLDRRISNAGRLHDIRERDPQQIFTTGGIAKYSMLGSHNAISYVPIAYASPEPEPEKKNLPGVPTPDTAGGKSMYGTTQSEASKAVGEMTKREREKAEKEKAISDKAVEPSHEPPYYLPQEQGQLDEMVKFLEERYGAQDSRKAVDDLRKDARMFTETVNGAKEIGKAINEWRQKDMGNEWLMNQVKKVAQFIVDKSIDLAKDKIGFDKLIGAGKIATGSTEGAKAGLDLLKDFIKNKFLKPADVEGGLKAIQDALFSIRPFWKRKWDSMLAVEIANDKKRIAEYMMEEATKKQDTGTVIDMLQSGKKKAAEPPKKRKLKTTMSVKI